MTDVSREAVAIEAGDGHRWQLLATVPATPGSTLLWLPAMGVAAKHYQPFADALAARGVATFVHEWRGNGSSNLRASREQDWGYNELLSRDLPASENAIAARFPDTERILGGHSLGGQLACCRLALTAQDPPAPPTRRLWLVASGSPYWRAFPAPVRFGLPLAYRFLPWLADRHGVLPGRRLGFAGQEARGVIRDWARSAISGRYAAAGMPIDRGMDPGYLHPGVAGPGDAKPGHTVPEHVDPEHLDLDLDRAMRRVDADVDAIVMQNDWLAPRSSLQYLLSKLGDPGARVAVLDAAALGARADHFAWMKQPERVVDHLVG